MNSEEFSQLLQSRCSTRDFKPDPIPQATLDAILDDARYCPSWSNTRPYMIALATGDRLKRISDAYLKEFDRTLGIQHKDKIAILKAPFNGTLPDGDFKTYKPYPRDLTVRRREVGKGLFNHLGIARGDTQARDAHNRSNLELFGAPVGMWFFVHRGLMPFAAMDVGIMLQTLILSAKANGVDSCALGVMATWRHPIDAEFDVPKDYKLITGLALGYASDAPVNDYRAPHPAVQMVPAKDSSSSQ